MLCNSKKAFCGKCVISMDENDSLGGTICCDTAEDLAFDEEAILRECKYAKQDGRVQHDVKILPEYFEAVVSGVKKFELRIDDRNYCVGDIVCLKEWTTEKGFTGRMVTRSISYVLRNCPEYGLVTGYCIIGWK